ncbi:MAG: Nif3-like dinuclear metal center hexameric protein [Oscillospiraceae bacterium]|nr:Nif3-like dinuclear metal center hexameric protein [Oscillospiraceae bacterium]
MITVKHVYDYLEKIAPFATQIRGDNSGFLVGDLQTKVFRILVCLDATNKVVAEAADKKAELIISHHPLMYRGIEQLFKGEPVFDLVQNGINLIAAHTNLDVADGGITDLMLTKLGFPPSDDVVGATTKGDTEFGKITVLDKAISAKELAQKCKVAFDCTSVRYVDGGKLVKKIGVCSGGGGKYVELAFKKGCDAYVCGDLRNDRLVFADNVGLTLVDAGHFHTENIFCDDMVIKLQKAFPELSVAKAENSVDLCDYV